VGQVLSVILIILQLFFERARDEYFRWKQRVRLAALYSGNKQFLRDGWKLSCFVHRSIVPR